jgi:hypothetical protein
MAIDAALVVDPLVQSSFRIPQSEGSILASLEGGAIIDEKRSQEIWSFYEPAGQHRFLAGTAVSVRSRTVLTWAGTHDFILVS